MSRDNSPVREKKIIKKVFLLVDGNRHGYYSVRGMFFEIEVARAAAKKLMSNKTNRKWEERHPNDWRWINNSDSICIEEKNIWKTVEEWNSENGDQKVCGAYDCFNITTTASTYCDHSFCKKWICENCWWKRTLCEEHRK